MNIKKGDKVKILAGKDRNKNGKVLQVFPKNRASVEGLNLLIKHLRPRRQGESGQRVEFPASINTSNLALICPKCGKTTKKSHIITKDKDAKQKKFRACKKCKQTID